MASQPAAASGSWRPGVPPPAPAAGAPAAGAAADPVAPAKQQGQISVDRTQDLYWQTFPQDFDRVLVSRDQTASGRREYKRVAKSRMPVVFEKLKPDSIFDPRDAWAKEKEARIVKEKGDQKAAEQAEAEERAAKAAAKGGKGKKPKAAKESKSEQMKRENTERMERELVKSDEQFLDNAAKAAKSKDNIAAVLKVKPKTPYGKLRQLLLILSTAMEIGDLPTTFEVLWALEASKAFSSAMEEVEAKQDAKEDKKDKKDKKKDKKDKKDKKEDKKEKVKEVVLSEEGELCYKYRKDVKKALSLRKKEKDGEKRDMVKFQLVEMHDRLPPLSRFNRTFKLDDWQCRVLEMVDQELSAVVCAPTSSGKTVISTYVTVKVAAMAGSGGGVLFVVPSEPLVWQVAAMFEKLMPGQVALCTNLLSYRPEKAAGQSQVVVGTPTSLESALSKVRGLVGIEVMGKNDYAQMLGGFEFKYAVFDEVHALDGDEGAALQRLMRLVECPFLALSATIGNAPALQSFWSSVRDVHYDVQVSEHTNEVGLQRHEGRFINLQRLVMKNGMLEPLHPCAAVDTELLQNQTFDDLSMSFTPRDAYALWEAFQKHLPMEEIEFLEPKAFFDNIAEQAIEATGAAAVPKNYVHQITLEQSKSYEAALKTMLVDLARDPQTRPLIENVLNEFTTGATDIDPAVDLMAFAMSCKEKGLFPALAFQLDSFQTIECFKNLLGALEQGQAAKYPEYYDELEAKALAKQKEQEELAKSLVTQEDKEEAMRDGATESSYIDTMAPHPEFVLAPPTAQISTVEFEDILAEMKKDKEPLAQSHVFARGLRRGIAIYIDDVGSATYRRKVQQLAQQGKLAVVFSDHSLAYGVNMPFRTCAFCGQMGDLLTPLMAQQMGGRAGRRGLDTQGNLAYLGMPFDQIKELMLGRIPAIAGKEAQYPTMVLQETLCVQQGRNYQEVPHVDARKMQGSSGQSFLQHQIRAGTWTGPEKDVPVPDQVDDYYECSSNLLQAINLIDEDKNPTAGFTGLTMMWELRHIIPQALVLTKCLPRLMEEFVVGKSMDHAERETVQIEFYTRLLHILEMGRTADVPDGTTPLAELSYINKDDERKSSWDDWDALIQSTQDELDALSDEIKAGLEVSGGLAGLKLAKPVGAPLDSRLFDIVKNNKLPTDLPSAEKYELKQRLFELGTVLLKMHNCLCQPGEYQKMELVTRKCFTRIKYILADSIKDETDLPDVTGMKTVELEDEDEDEEGGAAEEKKA